MCNVDCQRTKLRRNKIFIFIVIFALTINTQAKGYFAGYDFGEMTFNEFKYFSGGFGYTRENGQTIKFIRMNVVATEAHLASDGLEILDGK